MADSKNEPSVGTLIVVDPEGFTEDELRYWWEDDDLASHIEGQVGVPVTEENFVFVSLPSVDTAIFALLDENRVNALPTSYTEVEVRRMFLDRLHWLAEEFATKPGEDLRFRLHHLIVAVLEVLDGKDVMLPAFKLEVGRGNEEVLSQYHPPGRYFRQGIKISDGHLATKYAINEITPEERALLVNRDNTVVSYDTKARTFSAMVKSVEHLPRLLGVGGDNSSLLRDIINDFIEIDSGGSYYGKTKEVVFKGCGATVTGDIEPTFKSYK